MFTCCSKTNVIEPTAIVPVHDKSRKMTLNKLLSAPLPKVRSLKGTMLLKDDPTSPDLTPDEIQKIQKNLMLVKEFHEAIVNVQDKVLLEVWPILLNKSLENVDSKTAWQSHILSITSTICAVVSAATVKKLSITP